MCTHSTTPLAIIGIGCRLPGDATNPEKLWDLLSEQRSCWTKVPEDRFNESAFFGPNPDASGSHNHRGGHFLSQDIAAFDAEFFSISPAEARSMDPQQKILLETTYEAFESCGRPLESLQGSNTGVYAAVFSRDYDRIVYTDKDDIPRYQTTGTGDAILANRISYAFDLKGPSMTLDTGCSGSLVALHQACQSLRIGETDMAVAAGVNLILSPDAMIGMTSLHLLNKDGRSYSFDSRGSGYGRGEGSAVVIVKRLDDALSCGDPIRAVIRSTASNQDGRTSGITVPNQVAQEQLQRSIYENAGLDPSTVGYIEAHGTGTKAGDLAEIGAIRNVFCTDRILPLYVGSIKSNIGHLEAASGLAGLIKAVSVLEKGIIPPNVGFETPKKALRLEDGKLMVPKKLEPFGDYATRRVSVNSFGYGGSNAHAILEQSPHLDGHRLYVGVMADAELTSCRSLQTTGQELPQLLLLSARTKASLWSAVSNLREWISVRQNTVNLKDLASTLALHRTMFDWRVGLVANDCVDVMQATHSLRPDRSLRRISPGTRVVFIFTGQGAQWYAMGRELILTCPPFRASLSRASLIIRGLGASWDLVDLLLLPESESCINQSKFAQPACTALQVALVDVLEMLNVRPQTVLGHSSGEIAAAYAAGSLSQTAAIRIAYFRSFVSTSWAQPTSAKGAMLAVGLSEEGTNLHLRRLGYDDVCVACVNSPTSTIVSGNEISIFNLHDKLQDSAIYSKVLNIDTAYHSPEMEKVSTKYLEKLDGMETKTPKKSITFISTVTALEKGTDFGPGYWVSNLVSTVQFSSAILRLYRIEQEARRSYAQQSKSVLIEVGPHPTLKAPIRQTLQLQPGAINFEHLYTCSRGLSASKTFLGLVGNLFQHGVPIDLAQLQSMTAAPSGYTLIHDLPSYAWDHSHRHWHESRLSVQHRFRKHAYHDLLGTRIPSSTSLEPRWRHLVSLDALPWLGDHIVDDLVIFPGAAYLCMAIEAVRQLRDDRRQPTSCWFKFKGVRFTKALVIPPAPAKVEVHFGLDEIANLAEADDTRYCQFRISAVTVDGTWNEHCRGLLKVSDMGHDGFGAAISLHVGRIPLEISNTTATDSAAEISPNELYQRLKSNGNFYGPSFAAIKDAFMVSKVESRTRVDIPNVAQTMPACHMSPHVVHPTTLDALMHASLPLLTEQLGPGSVMPTAIDELHISSAIESTPGQSLRTVTSLMKHGPRSAKAGISVFNANAVKNPVLQLSGLELRWFPQKPNSTLGPTQPRKIGLCMKWAVDVDTMSPSSFSLKVSSSPMNRSDLLNRAAKIYMDRSLTALDNPCQVAPPLPTPRFMDFVRWMRRERLISSDEDLAKDVLQMSDNDVLERIQDHEVEDRMLTQIGQNLTSILTGCIEPLDLILRDDGLRDLYPDFLGTQCNAHLARFLKYLCFKKPRLRILEVGGGEGSTALSILTALQSEGSVLGDYAFTDLSAGSFDKVKDLLVGWASMVTFKKLDVSRDPAVQGFNVHTYDVVIAANVLHNTSSIGTSLANIHKLLKPGGKLALIEMTRMQRYLGLIFGIIPRRWQDAYGRRQDEAITSQAEWRSYLSSQHFGGLDLAVDDCIGPLQTSTLLVSSATTPDQLILRRPVKILLDEERSDWSRNLADILRSVFESHGIKASTVRWSSYTPTMDVSHVVIDDSSCPLLLTSTSTRFNHILHLLSNAGNILWISGHGDARFKRRPEAGLVTGLARTAHAENQALRLVTLDIQQPIDGRSIEAASAIYDVLVRSFAFPHADETNREREYIYVDQQILIPRLVPHDSINDWIDQSKDLKGSPLGICVCSHDLLKQLPATLSSSDNADFLDDEIPKPRSEAYDMEFDVEIRVIGQGDPSPTCTQNGKNRCFSDHAGIVTAVGSKVPNLAVGQRVAAFASNSFANTICVNYQNAVRLPDSLPFTVGGATPFAFITAYYCLVSSASLRPEQSILVLTAGRTVGQAAIRIAKHIGATVSVIASSNYERDLLIRDLGLLPSHVIFAETEELTSKLHELTTKSGVDVLLSCGYDPLTADDLRYVTHGGTVLQVVNSKISSAVTMTAAIPTDKNLTFKIFDIMSFMRNEPEEAVALLEQVASLAEKSLLQIPKEPLTKLATSNEDGMIEVPPWGQYEGIDHHGSPLILDSNATYVIAGGLGDLGWRLVHLMVRRGAKHVVVISRRDFNADEHRHNEEEIKLISPEARLYWWTCDVANKSQVMQCAADLPSRGLPPVKGLVHSAIALHDRTLSSLTLDDFKIPLQAKLYGTQNLWAAFRTQQLDFFIILSSLSGIVGPGGQGSYAAGNAFQDAFANSISTEPFPCVSLDIGFIENAKIVNALREKNLRRYGFVQLSSHELQASLEYAMNPQATRNQCRQIVVGCDWRSISQVDIANATASSPLFSHIRQPLEADTLQKSRKSDVALGTVVAESSDVEEVHRNVLLAIVQRISTLVASDGLEQNLDASMTQLGLDSLITVELRNWISTEAAAATQVSEILDQTSIRNLAVLVSSRSAFIQARIRQLSSEPVEENDNSSDSPSATSEAAAKHGISTNTYLPTPPLPDLATSLNMYFESRRFFLSNKEAAHTSRAIEAFKQPDGLGQKLQERLLERSRDLGMDNWISEPYARKIYLDRRDPVHPSSTFYCGHVLADVAFTQAEKAALLAAATFEFKRLLSIDAIESEDTNGEPVSLDSLHWLFNAVREAGRRTDNMRAVPDHDHIIALRRGHIFKIRLANKPGREPYQRFKAAFEHVLAHSEDCRPSLATMTADERSVWAQVRDDSVLIHELNKATMSVIESAAFVVCLDDGEPKSASERCNQFFLGDPANRWSDKTLQFIICKNGVSAFVCEHAMLDGMNGRQLNIFVTRAIQAHQAAGVNDPGLLDSEDLVEELGVVIDPAVEKRITLIQERFSEQNAPIEFTHHTVRTFGSNFLRKHKCPAKTGYQVVIQLACLLYYGYQPESWETLSMSRFHKGRVDWIQAVQPSMAAFCAAARDNTTPRIQQRQMFFDAVHVFANTTTQILRGHGFKAHLHVLLAMVRDDEPVPALFQDKAWRDTTVSSVKTVKTDCLEGAMLQETAFLMPEPKCIFVHYEVEDDGCKFFVQTWPGRSKSFCDALEQAATTIKEIVVVKE